MLTLSDSTECRREGAFASCRRTSAALDQVFGDPAMMTVPEQFRREVLGRAGAGGVYRQPAGDADETRKLAGWAQLEEPAQVSARRRPVDRQRRGREDLAGAGCRPPGTPGGSARARSTRAPAPPTASSHAAATPRPAGSVSRPRCLRSTRGVRLDNGLDRRYPNRDRRFNGVTSGLRPNIARQLLPSTANGICVAGISVRL